MLHTSGESLTSVTPLAVNAGRNATQEWGKAVTYHRRYALLAALGMCVGIVDNDADSDAVTKPEAKLEIQQSPKIEGVADEDQPLTTKDRNTCLSIINEMPAGKKENFCKSFRFAFKLGDNAKVSAAITSRKHMVWIQQNA